MKRSNLVFGITLLASIIGSLPSGAQDENPLKLSGELLTDQRLLLQNGHDWAWNETRLTLNLSKRITSCSKFYSDIWLRNIGLPNVYSSSDLYNKGIVDPYNLEIREAYVEIYGFLIKNLDMAIGRQRIVWGSADKFNPTDNLNPLDMEDILDFGRRRGSDAINVNYYFNNKFSLQGVFIPLFRQANMPIGIFSGALNPDVEAPLSMISLRSFSDTLLLPRNSIGQSSTSGLKFKGFVKNVDFSLSYTWDLDGLPFNTRNTLIPVDTLGGMHIASQLSFARSHILGADLATSIRGFGVWAEAALFIPEKDVIMTTDLSALFPSVPFSTEIDSVIIDKTKPYLKYILGIDYFLADGSYFNLQYLHGFVHERGDYALNDYFFVQYEKSFLNEKLKVAPVVGGFILKSWEDIGKNYAWVYMPSITYKVSINSELLLSCVLFDGKGDNFFAKMTGYDMAMLKFKYSF